MCKKYCIKCDCKVKGDRLVCELCNILICNSCTNKGYMYDTGYGINDIRFIDENDECDVCHSDPYEGPHKDWFINYIFTHEICNKCKTIKDIDYDCEKCFEIKCGEEDYEKDVQDFFKKLRIDRIKERAFGDVSLFHSNNIIDYDTIYNTSNETDIDEIE